MLCSVSWASTAEAASLAILCKTSLRPEAWGDRRMDRQSVTPLKVLHPPELSAAVPVKPALPYRVCHHNQQRGPWLLHEDSNISSLSFPSPLAGVLAVTPETSLLFQCRHRRGICAVGSVFAPCSCVQLSLRASSAALPSRAHKAPGGVPAAPQPSRSRPRRPLPHGARSRPTFGAAISKTELMHL